jgi:hypothetical protein
MRYISRVIVGLIFYGLLVGALVSPAVGSEPGSVDPDRRWSDRSLRISISDTFFQQTPAIKHGSAVSDAVRAATEAWAGVAKIEFDLVNSNLSSVSGSRSKGDGTNLITAAATSENLALFPKRAQSPPAFTRLFFDQRGAIIEADIVLNSYLQFSTDGTSGTFDLQAVVTHELGHLLGLAHSSVKGAMMFQRMAPNRSGASTALDSRILSDSDVAAVRALYGPARSEDDCCITIAGNLPGGPQQVVWAEDNIGRLAAASLSSSGRFSVGGLLAGKYKLLSQGFGTTRLEAVELANREFELPEIVDSTRTGRRLDVGIDVIGLNGEMQDLPVDLSVGRSYQLFVGGPGLDPKTVVFGTSAGSISVAPGSAVRAGESGGLSVVAFTLVVGPDTALGDYSVYAENATGARQYLLGSLSVH